MLPPPYVGSYGEERLFQEKDMAGLYYIAKLLKDQDREKNFIYVGLGRSPLILTAFMRKVFDVEAIDLPLSITLTLDDKYQGYREVPYEGRMKEFLEEYLPMERIRGKSLVLIDYVDSGYSMRSARRLLKKHIGDNAKLYIAPLTELTEFLNDEDSLLRCLNDGAEDASQRILNNRASHRLLKVLKVKIDKDILTPYPSISEEHIHSGGQILLNNKVKTRLDLVLEAAILQLVGEGGHGIVKTLEASKYLGVRKRPNRSVKDTLKEIPTDGQRPRDIVAEQHFIEKYKTESAGEYRIPKSAFAYYTLKSISAVRKHPKGAVVISVVLFALICYLIVGTFRGGSNLDEL